MAEDTSATILTLVQPKRAMTPAERAKAYRDRKRAKEATVESVAVPAQKTKPELPSEPVAARQGSYSFVTSRPVTAAVTPSRPSVASVALTLSAFGLGAVGITINGWFARSLGATEAAGWLFLAIGVAADLVALALPSAASRAWQGRQRGTALAAWSVWAMTFAFALMAGVGFASLNITDVTASRASRTTPAVVTAQTALADAMAARDRECKGGVGKFCRERETSVTERRQALDIATKSVEMTADPQTEAAVRIITWVSAGVVRPAADDLATLRLILLALLPQVGGILLMVGRVRA